MNQMMFALSLGIGGMWLAADMARGETQCDARDRVLAFLSERYRETRRPGGLAGEPEGGSYGTGRLVCA